MMLMDKTSEKLRSKHVRTLELLQKTLDDNVDLRDQIGRLQKGTLHLDQGIPRSNRDTELEDEISRLKAEQCARIHELEETGKARHAEVTRSVETLQRKALTLQNEVLTLETALLNAKDKLKTEKAQWDDERVQILEENSRLHEELSTLRDPTSNNQQHESELQRLRDEVHAISHRELEARELTQVVQDRATRIHCDLEMQQQRVQDHLLHIDSLQSQLATVKEREAALTQELVGFRERHSELHSKLTQQQLQPSLQSVNVNLQQQHTVVLAQLSQVEGENELLRTENRALLDQIAKLHAQLHESTKANNSSGVFAVHVELKRENFQLKAQVEELKQLQKRFLTTAKKKTMSFPAI